MRDTLKVIGAGFGRTGTLSLKTALDELGFGPCYHMMEVFDKPRHIELWQAAGEGASIDWDELFIGYHAAVDWQDVKDRVPAERLLVYDVKEGWAPLCRFLNVAVPEGKAFPRLNDASEFQQRAQNPQS